MRVSWNWLNEYMDLSDVTPEQVADDLSLAGLEVEHLWQPGKNLDGLVVGYVEKCESVEESDKLNKTKVNIGEKTISIVCGAPNIEAGQNVIVAQVGTVLPGDFEIKSAKILDETSEGMICSLEELGFSDSVIPKYEEDGIYILPEEAEIGADARPYIGLDDAIIEIDLTPNRADALSMRGVAYDVAAIYDKELHFDRPVVEEDDSENIADWIKVNVQSTDDVADYKMRIAVGADIKPSPYWLQVKLMNAGIRPIDTIVDITNYVMLEYGQPLHAFDYKQIQTDQIYVRRAQDGEEIVTLDGRERHLTSESLVVTNGETPLAIAGVMGGQNSEIEADTRQIAIESAVFHPTLTRKTANALNLRSESSNRFEKGVNRATVQEAADFAAQLMHELAGAKIVSGTAEIEAKPIPEVQIELTADKVDSVIGEPLSKETILNILERLRFEVKEGEDALLISIPPRRWDISIAEDVIEEIARIYGYNNIHSTLPVTASIPGELTTEQQMIRHMRHFMEGSGLMETVNYSLTSPEKAVRFALKDGQAVHLDNPMSEERQTLRQSLLTGLIDAAHYNQARHNEMIALYETGHVYEQIADEEFREDQHIAAILSAPSAEKHWLETDQSLDFYSVKGLVESLLSEYAWAGDIRFEALSSSADWHPGRSAAIYIAGERVGVVGQIHPKISEAMDLEEVYAFELSIAHLLTLKLNTVTYNPVQKYPSIGRDIAMIVDRHLSHQEIVDTIYAAGGQYLQSVEIFDLYSGDSIDEDKKSVAYSLLFASPEYTLQEDTVNESFAEIVETLEDKFEVEIR